MSKLGTGDYLVNTSKFCLLVAQKGNTHVIGSNMILSMVA